MRIILAKNIGFCSGVRRALDLVENAINKGASPFYLLGSLVHNEGVMDGFLKKGVKGVSSIDKIPVGATVVIPAHGIGPEMKKKLTVKQIKLIDATCPQVLKIQRLAQAASKNKEQVVIFGDKTHQEVKGIKGWAKNQAKVILTLNDLRNLRLGKAEKVTLLSQTTQSKEEFNKIVNFCKKHFSNIKIYQTICPEILARFGEVRTMAKKCDLLLVVGSRSSANTKRLFKLAKRLIKNTVWVTGQIKASKKGERVGIISGASTPLTTINKLCELLGEKLNKSK